MEPIKTSDLKIGDLTPTDSQSRAAAAVDRAYRIREVPGVQIVGYAGVGKTTLIRLFGKLYGDPRVVAPTGKAALRITEATGMPASTFHRWMYDPGTDEMTGKPTFKLKDPSRLRLPNCGLVLVDEASMVGLGAWSDMWNTCQKLGLKIVLIGDGFQLPPVEPRGAAKFSTMTPEFAAKHELTRVEMTDIVRQALDSPVVQAATKLREGVTGALSGLSGVSELGETCYNTLQAGGVIIAHTNVTRHKANTALRQPVLSSGEPLLVLRNDYDLDVYNGQQLRFQAWEREPASMEPVVVVDKFRGTTTQVQLGVARVDGMRVLLCPQQIDGSLDASEIAVDMAGRQFAKRKGLRCEHREEIPMPVLHANYGYCYTAHKAQGSEWPYALVVLEKTVRMGTEDGRRWAYTAITRAKQGAAVYYGTP